MQTWKRRLFRLRDTSLDYYKEPKVRASPTCARVCVSVLPRANELRVERPALPQPQDAQAQGSIDLTKVVSVEASTKKVSPPPCAYPPCTRLRALTGPLPVRCRWGGVESLL